MVIDFWDRRGLRLGDPVNTVRLEKRLEATGIIEQLRDHTDVSSETADHVMYVAEWLHFVPGNYAFLHLLAQLLNETHVVVMADAVGRYTNKDVVVACFFKAVEPNAQCLCSIVSFFNKKTLESLTSNTEDLMDSEYLDASSRCALQDS